MGVPILKPLDVGKLDVPASTTATADLRPPVNTLWTPRSLIVNIQLDVSASASDLARYRLILKDNLGVADDIILDQEELVAPGAATFLKQYALEPSVVAVGQPLPLSILSLDNERFIQVYGETGSVDTVVLNWWLTGLERPLP